MNRCNVTNTTYQDGRSLDIAWNDRYEITSVSTNGTTLESYEYDALGRRVKIENAGSTNYLVYDGIHVVAEVDSDGTLQKSYTWGPGVDNLLVWTDYSGGNTNTYYALTDHLCTVHAVADSTGAIVESYRFDSWGRVLGVYDSNGQPLSESAIGNHYLWQGRWFSWTTGLYDFRFRVYDPVIGRWFSKDPIRTAGGMNQCSAFACNPVMFCDPLGLDVWIEKGSGQEPAGHIGLSVGDPLGKYETYSFGATAFTLTGGVRGSVYQEACEDTGGKIMDDYYYHTAPDVDLIILNKLEHLSESTFENKPAYRIVNANCRTWTFGQFKLIGAELEKHGKGVKGKPPVKRPKKQASWPWWSSSTTTTRATSRPASGPSTTTTSGSTEQHLPPHAQ